jgi:hypothetical protein
MFRIDLQMIMGWSTVFGGLFLVGLHLAVPGRSFWHSNDRDLPQDRGRLMHPHPASHRTTRTLLHHANTE